jgi:transposase
VRMINRLRDLMTSVFPSLEREFDYSSHKGALVLLTGYASPDRIRRVGQTRLAGWLRHRKVRDYASMAARAVDAAKAQSTVLPGQDLATTIVAELATSILALDERLKTLDEQIEQTFKQHPQATIIQSMPGFGPFLGAALLVGAGDLRAFPSAGHLAAAAGLVPVPNDSGRRTGNLHRPHRYSRPLRHVFYLSAQTSMMRAGPNRDYYLKKRAHGRTHSQAVISLARRRVDVLWSLLRDNRRWVVHPPEHAQAA